MKEVKGYLVCDARKSGGLLAVDTVLQALPGRCLDLDILQLPGDKGDLVLEGDGFIWEVILIIVLFPLLFSNDVKVLQSLKVYIYISSKLFWKGFTFDHVRRRVGDAVGHFPFDSKLFENFQEFLSYRSSRVSTIKLPTS